MVTGKIANLLLGLKLIYNNTVLKTYNYLFVRDPGLLFEKAEEIGANFSPFNKQSKALIEYTVLVAKIRNEVNTDNTYLYILSYLLQGSSITGDIDVIDYIMNLYQSQFLYDLMLGRADKRDYENTLWSSTEKAYNHINVIKYFLDKGVTIKDTAL